MIKYEHVGYDWKQAGAEEEYEKALSKFGLVMTNDPVMECTDQISLFITKTEPTKEQLREIQMDHYGEEFMNELNEEDD